jgi:hypothetical protein
MNTTDPSSNKHRWPFVTQEGNMPNQDEDLSNVPESVKKQQREADRKIKEAQEPSSTPDITPENTDDPPVVPVDPPAAAPAAAPVEAAVAPVINDGTGDGQWEHKYKVLQGKYNSEVPELTRKVEELTTQMERQDTVIQGLNSQHSEQAPSKIDIDDLNPEDFQGWGDEMKVMVDTVNKLKLIVSDQNSIIAGFKGQPAAGAANTDGELQGRVENLESNANDTRITSYIKYLDDNIKGKWRVLNKNANFINWLNVIDPVSMQSRKAALTAAAENLRGAQVASIFNLYIGENGGDAGAVIADELPAGGGDGGGDLTPKPELTQADVTKAQSDFVKGKITEAEFDVVYSKYQSTLRRQLKA